MSTRKGNTIWLRDILDEAVERAKKINAESAEMVGIGAIKFNDLKREAKQDIVFDWDEVVALKGDSGPYLQYSAVRAKSVLNKAREEKIAPADLADELPSGWETNMLEKKLYRFPEVVERAGKEYAPHFISNYLIDIAADFNAFYAKEQIVTKDESAPYKLSLTRAFSIVIANGLELLGISIPEKM